MDLYDSLPKIDAHMHYNCARPALLEQARSEGFRLLSINTEVPFFPLLKEQEDFILDRERDEQKSIDYITTFSTDKWGTEDWQEKALAQIKNGMEKGAVGVKFWKNIGMELRDENGDFVMIDDPSFDPLFEYCEDKQVPVLGHLGEPKNCWLPVEEMTVNGDREYFAQHPEYHMYRHPEYPSYEEQIEARDRRLEKHPKLRFVGAHLASLEWSVDRIADWLDRFPNAAVDLAERVCHLQYQAVRNWEKVHNFLVAYQDRIIYGTDIIDDRGNPPEEIKKKIKEKWHMHWKFFSDRDTMSVPKVENSFRGLGMDEPVMKKIFRKNALKWYPRLDRD
ncbi:amidohydrolase [Aliifodinibius sp. S!AR15-10]|uniref:amidohydrolase family protein n=1 Tax=Aliifodinibius sp. S!AR15-10 TaxID=2950437 RepID=UPI00285F3A6B|nr:amidohydrolase family protein [Aliifodinibius sp. S!AR15-10]MDR8392132.1 amidohydrolase [Aliifodinibius sp. S!AR15-10]